MILRNCSTIRSLCSQLLCSKSGQAKVSGGSVATGLQECYETGSINCKFTIHIMFDSTRPIAPCENVIKRGI
jgi:hypothetical protein